MRRILFAPRRMLVCMLVGAFAFGVSSCAPQTDKARKTSEAGGTIPWNRPASWEGPGVLGSQMSQMQGGGSGF